MFKRWMSAVCAAAFCSAPALASVLALDTFSTYTPGELNGQSGRAKGFTGVWDAFPAGAFTITSDNHLRVDNGVIPPPLDGSATHQFWSLSSAWLPTNGSFLYVSYLLTVPDVADLRELQTGFYMYPHRGGAWTTGIDQGRFFLVYSTGQTLIVPGQQYRIVSRIQRNDSGPNPLVLWINPASEAASPEVSTNVQVLADPSDYFDRITFQIFYGSRDVLTVDDLRVGNTFRDVVP